MASAAAHRLHVFRGDFGALRLGGASDGVAKDRHNGPSQLHQSLGAHLQVREFLGKIELELKQELPGLLEKLLSGLFAVPRPARSWTT